MSDSWITLKFLQEFLEAVFVGVAIKTLLGDKEVWSGQTRVTTPKGPNF